MWISAKCCFCLYWDHSLAKDALCSSSSSLTPTSCLFLMLENIYVFFILFFYERWQVHGILYMFTFVCNWYLCDKRYTKKLCHWICKVMHLLHFLQNIARHLSLIYWLQLAGILLQTADHFLNFLFSAFFPHTNNHRIQFLLFLKWFCSEKEILFLNYL